MKLIRLATMGNNDPTVPPIWIDQDSGNIYVGPRDNPTNVYINGDMGNSVYTAAADGPISLTDMEGVVLITKGSACAMTLDLPKAGAHPTGQDGHTIRFVPMTAFAHTITVPPNGFNGNKHILTLVPPSGAIIVGSNGVWDLCPNNAGTLS